jgi:hypothetical protein
MNTKNDIPKVTHYAALIFRQIQHQGDERSRANLGHGYPAYLENVVDYRPFKDEAELKSWIIQQEKRGAIDYIVIKSSPLAVSTQLQVSLS